MRVLVDVLLALGSGDFSVNAVTCLYTLIIAYTDRKVKRLIINKKTYKRLEVNYSEWGIKFFLRFSSVYAKILGS